MQTLIPPPVTANARPKGRRLGRALAFGLTPRSFALFAAATLLSIPAFYHAHHIVLMWGADILLVLLMLADGFTLPAPEGFSVSRRFERAPELGHPVEIKYTIAASADRLLSVLLTDDLHPSLAAIPPTLSFKTYAREPVTVRTSVTPRERGDLMLRKIYLRYRSVLGLIERWAVLDAEQPVRIYAAGEAAGDTDLYLLRARQIELQKRKLRLLGLGREFENMRDYQPGDELRNISWTATARHSRLITQQFTTERSQQVWILIDAGRLSRTSFSPHPADAGGGATAMLDHDESSMTQLDAAAAAAGMLARVIAGSGDKSALLTYGRTIQQQILPGAGMSHLRQMMEALSQVRSDASEADHRKAAARLRHLQRKRGVVLWITEMTDTAGRPEIVAAAAQLVRQHLVVLVLLQHAELDALAGSAPGSVRAMYQAAAAQEVLERRRENILRLRRQGILIVETTADRVGPDTVARYLEVKAQGKL